MTYITTNVRLPKDLYFELKTQAARERKSVAALIRERLANPASKHAMVKDDAAITPEFMALLKKINTEYGPALKALASK